MLLEMFASQNRKSELSLEEQLEKDKDQAKKMDTGKKKRTAQRKNDPNYDPDLLEECYYDEFLEAAQDKDPELKKLIEKDSKDEKTAAGNLDHQPDYLPSEPQGPRVQEDSLLALFPSKAYFVDLFLF